MALKEKDYFFAKYRNDARLFKAESVSDWPRGRYGCMPGRLSCDGGPKLIVSKTTLLSLRAKDTCI